MTLATKFVISGDGRNLVVSRPGFDAFGASNVGRLHWFRKDEITKHWEEVASVLGTEGHTRLGRAVVMDGNVLVASTDRSIQRFSLDCVSGTSTTPTSTSFRPTTPPLSLTTNSSKNKMQRIGDALLGTLGITGDTSRPSWQFASIDVAFQRSSCFLVTLVKTRLQPTWWTISMKL